MKPADLGPEALQLTCYGEGAFGFIGTQWPPLFDVDELLDLPLQTPDDLPHAVDFFRNESQCIASRTRAVSTTTVGG
ncbi:MAG: hypothetical protein HY332_00620 [Chloroflexi bacterium]|nr:hypothetical protein [Chloroflexota bacterium]